MGAGLRRTSRRRWRLGQLCSTGRIGACREGVLWEDSKRGAAGLAWGVRRCRERQMSDG